MSREKVILTWFPGLQTDPCFKILDPEPGFPNVGYNCFAYALGHLDQRLSVAANEGTSFAP